MKFTEHPLWLVGFRPFFALASLAGLSLPVIWALMYSGMMPAPAAGYSSVQWHAHEMFFGFGWAVLGGFLLTSTKNWVNVRGYHGGSLAYLAAAWVFERVGMAFGGHWPQPLFLLSNLLFLVSMVAMVSWTLLRNREKDVYRSDNFFFLLMLPAFIVAKLLVLSHDHFAVGIAMAIGLFRLAFLLMLERTLTQFMSSVFKVAILRDPRLDVSIKGLATVYVFSGFMPAGLAAGIAVLLAALLAFRLAHWKFWLAMQRLDIGVMHLGYLAIVIQLALDALGAVLPLAWVGTVSVHVFTFGVMGLVVPAMIMRISKGHTGRKVMFDATDLNVLRIAMLGFALRILAPQIFPSAYLHWIALSALCWFAAFSIIAWRYIPMLAQPRVDGREH